jgi:hypothetical protein
MMGTKVTSAADELFAELAAEEDRNTGLNIFFQHLQVNVFIISIPGRACKKNYKILQQK